MNIKRFIAAIVAFILIIGMLPAMAESVDMTSMMTSMMGVQAELEENQHEKDAVYSSTVLYEMMNSMVSADTQTNNLKPLKAYIEDENNEIGKYISSIQYSYVLEIATSGQ